MDPPFRTLAVPVPKSNGERTEGRRRRGHDGPRCVRAEVRVSRQGHCQRGYGQAASSWTCGSLGRRRSLCLTAQCKLNNGMETSSFSAGWGRHPNRKSQAGAAGKRRIMRTCAPDSTHGVTYSLRPQGYTVIAI